MTELVVLFVCCFWAKLGLLVPWLAPLVPGQSTVQPLADTTPTLLQGPAQLNWPASATGIVELVLWRLAFGMHPASSDEFAQTILWARWAACLQRLRLVELRAGPDPDAVETAHVSYRAACVEGEAVEAMVHRMLWDLAVGF